MTTKEALQELENRGVELTYWKLRGMVTRKEIPAPRMNSTLKWDWTEQDLQNVIESQNAPSA